MIESEFYAILHLKPTDFEEKYSKENGFEFDPSIIIHDVNGISKVYASREINTSNGELEWVKENESQFILGYAKNEAVRIDYSTKKSFRPKKGFFPIKFQNKPKGMSLLNKIDSIEKLTFEEVENLFAKKIN